MKNQNNGNKQENWQQLCQTTISDQTMH